MIQLRIEKIQKIIQKEITVVQVASELAVSRKSVHIVYIGEDLKRKESFNVTMLQQKLV